jgi:hypothetical protein
VPWIQFEPILVGATDPRNDIEVRAEHDENALAPILVTLEGTVTELMAAQEANALAAIDVVPEGTINAVEPDPTKVPAPLYDVHVIVEIFVASMVPLVAAVIAPAALIVAPATDDEMVPRVEVVIVDAVRE